MAERVGMNEARTEVWWGHRAWALPSTVRARAPLVQCITNLASMDIAANALTAAGASPAMLHCIRELPDLTPRCDAVCINVGTLDEGWLPSMRAAASTGRPWVLDPVAVAAPASGWRPASSSSRSALPSSGGTRRRSSRSPPAQTTPHSRAWTVHMTKARPCKPQKRWQCPAGQSSQYLELLISSRMVSRSSVLAMVWQ